MSKRNKSSKGVNNKHKTLRRDKKDFLKELILQSGAPLESEITAFLANQANLTLISHQVLSMLTKMMGKGENWMSRSAFQLYRILTKRGYLAQFI